MKTLKDEKAMPVKRAKAKRPTGRLKNQFVLRLFVAGATDRSRQAILRVRELCADGLKGRVGLEVIDIYQQPALARTNQIVATPTLVIELPKPLRRFIGSLANIAALFAELDLVQKGKVAP